MLVQNISKGNSELTTAVVRLSEQLQCKLKYYAADCFLEHNIMVENIKCMAF